SLPAGPTSRQLSKCHQPTHLLSLQVSQALIRPFSSSARSHLENRVAEKQKLFQANNDLPVHLKGGAMDNILYRLTMTLTLGGECRAHTVAWVVD
ncbi:Cytochrome c oxidase subunit 7A1, mitochondrial, partial [Lemmus lemmus]